MFSLNGAVRYRYIPGYKDMRGGYASFAALSVRWAAIRRTARLMCSPPVTGSL